MPETDTASRARLLLMVGFLAVLFGGFAVWGTVERGLRRVNPVEEPAPVAADRAAFLAKQKKAFAARKQMATRGKADDWRGAVAVADAYLETGDALRNIRFLRGEALYRLGDKRGGAAMRDALRGNPALNEHEAGLVAGEIAPYTDATNAALRKIGDGFAAVLPQDANNTAWRAALIPGASGAAERAVAVRLSEYAVASARESRSDANDLATYTNTLGALLHRAGRGADAVRTLTQSEALRSDPFNAAYLALALREQGDPKQSAVWRERLRKHLANTYATRDGQEYRHQLLLLWREIETDGQEKTGAAVN